MQNQKSFLFLAAVALSFWNPMETQSHKNFSVNNLTGMTMSRSFCTRTDFIVDITCPFKRLITYWKDFDLPSSKLMLSNQMQVPV
jgi:hypothetical protein